MNNDFYDNCNLVEDDDIEKAKQNQSKDPIIMSHPFIKTSYEEVSETQKVIKEDLFQEEAMIESQKEYENKEEKKD
ncbi:MAG: hypothetical protein IKF71_02345 [Bacilli bacterium]|nr:hypothetical protein [Bacilli bacterium]